MFVSDSRALQRPFVSVRSSYPIAQAHALAHTHLRNNEHANSSSPTIADNQNRNRRQCNRNSRLSSGTELCPATGWSHATRNTDPRVRWPICSGAPGDCRQHVARSRAAICRPLDARSDDYAPLIDKRSVRGGGVRINTIAC